MTSHPSRLYNGKVLRRIYLETLDELIDDLEKQKGPIDPRAANMGVFTWDILCESAAGPFILQFPLVLDEPGRRGRSKREVPRLNVEHMGHFIAQGLRRFVMEPRELLTLGDGVPAATFNALPDYHRVTFGRGSIQIDLQEGELFWVVSLGPDSTADLLAEMVSALVYHYEPETNGGTALTDVFVNDCDFLVKRNKTGGFEVRLAAARQREGGIGPNLLLLYLIQMMAYEDWEVDGKLTGLPVLISNPSIAFEGLVRGLGYRNRDLGKSVEEGQTQALSWILGFGRSREGRAYRPWVERFLTGQLPLCFGGDLRERWWRLSPLQEKLGVLELRARHGHDTNAASSAEATRIFLERISLEIGHVPRDRPDALRINDLGRKSILQLLEKARVPSESRDTVADELLAHWPYRDTHHLLAQVPSASPLRRLQPHLCFGDILPNDDDGSLKSLGSLPKPGDPTRPLANPEIYGSLALPSALHARAVQTFPSFEAYMDAALHDEHWGYYARSVSIGRTGHFSTHPESLSPHYGKWMARWAFKAWQDLLAHAEISETDTFPIIEFGAGNGRLAQDFLDAITQGVDQPESPLRARWRAFAAQVRYRIYETSQSLRDKQRELLGDRVRIEQGDARRPDQILKRDFPNGVRGVVLSNEVPDAFGVHKVVLTREGRALVALVVPRVEPALRDAVSVELSRRIGDANARLRQRFDLQGNVDDFYLDESTFAEMMPALSARPADEHEAMLGALWFEEAYVPASTIPTLAEHLRVNATQYATALAAEDSGVVLYVNTHANRFINGLGASLAAGFIMTMDYGDTTWGLIQGARRGDFPFRVYFDGQDYVPRPNDPYSVPGTQDMTADVNFTDLAKAGQDAGLKLVHFGRERDVAGDDLPELLAAADQQLVSEFLGNPVFKLLVLGTRPSDIFRGALMTPLPLTRSEQEIPKSRRHRVATIERRLRSEASVY